MWEIVGQDILTEYSSLETNIIQSGASSFRYYILPNGFKDIGNALVFGNVNWGDKLNAKKCILQIEEVAKNKKIERIVGPLNFSTYFEYRLKMDNFENSSIIGEPDNPPEASEILGELGFKIEKLFFSHEFRTKRNFKFFIGVILFGYVNRLRFKNSIKLVPLSKLNINHYLNEIYNLTDEVFSSNFLYQKIPYKSFAYLFETKYLPFLESDASLVAINSSGHVVGYSLCLKDKNNERRLLFKTIAVKNEYRHKSFVGRQLMREVYLCARKKYSSCMACLMIEGNKPEKMFRKNSFYTKTFALFSKELPFDRNH